MNVEQFQKQKVNVVTTKISTVHKDTLVKDVMKLIQVDPNNLLAVIDNDDKLTGVVAGYDIFGARDVLDKTLEQSGIVKQAITIQMNEPIEIAIQKMEQHNLNKLVVVDANNKPIALVTKKTMLVEFAKQFKILM